MKNKKIRIILKIITICLILMIALSTIAFASDTTEDSSVFEKIMGGYFEAYQMGVTGITGIILLIPKWIILSISISIQGMLSLFLSASNNQGLWLQPDTILFNQVPLLDINFFSMSGGNNSSALYIIKENIANWYVGLRNLSTGALLAVIAYIGIRMALSTVAEDKSKYKKLLRYWVESFALLFLLHYIMIAIISFNNSIVEILSPSLSSIVDNRKLLAYALKPTVSGFVAAIIYAMNVGISVAFFIMYLKRVMMVGFLIVIAPLITITYSIDKVGDGKSQALDQWLKLFMYNVLIQPFHCILYLVFVSQSTELVSGFNIISDFEHEITRSTLAVLSQAYMFKLEEILKQIFGFHKAGNSVMSGLIAGQMIGKVVKSGVSTGTKVAKSGAKAIGDFTGLDKKIKNSKIGQEYDKFKSTKGGKLVTKAASKTVSGSANLAMATMVAPVSGSTAFGMLTSGSGDKSKKEKEELKDSLDKLEKELLPRLEEFLKGKSDYEKLQILLEASSLDFKDSGAVAAAFSMYNDVNRPGSGREFIALAEKIQAIQTKTEKLDGTLGQDVIDDLLNKLNTK